MGGGFGGDGEGEGVGEGGDGGVGCLVEVGGWMARASGSSKPRGE
jgi:hypothetical protein